MATHSSVLAWRIPGTGEPDGLPSMGSHRVGHDWSDLAAIKGHNKLCEWNKTKKINKTTFNGKKPLKIKLVHLLSVLAAATFISLFFLSWAKNGVGTCLFSIPEPLTPEATESDARLVLWSVVLRSELEPRGVSGCPLVPLLPWSQPALPYHLLGSKCQPGDACG